MLFDVFKCFFDFVECFLVVFDLFRVLGIAKTKQKRCCWESLVF